MKDIPENKAREERIANEVTVDAYGSEDVVVGWLTYLQQPIPMAAPPLTKAAHLQPLAACPRNNAFTQGGHP